MMRGEFAVELLGPESFTERIRATGRGLGGVLVPPDRRWGRGGSGAGHRCRWPATRLERPLRAQFALLAASRADAYFNLAYAHGTAEVASFMASAADCVIGEPETVERDALPSSVLQTSGVAVTYLVRPAR